MGNEQSIADGGPRQIAYIRPVDIAELPQELQRRAAGVEKLYAVHRADGERLALVDGRKLAFVLARQNDLAPVYVH